MDASRREELVQLCQELIRYPSPSGREDRVADFLCAVMTSLGYDDLCVDGYGSVMGTLRFGCEKRPVVLFEAQMDHAEEGDPGEWQQYPFGGVLEKGRIYGRGATDQKGILAAMVLALAWLRQDISKDLSGTLVLAAMVHQETFERAASRLVAEQVCPDGVISGEPSELTVERGQRGRASLVLETFGRMEHSSMGDCSSAERMVELVSFLKNRYVPLKDPFFGPSSLNLTSLHSFPLDVRTTMPLRCRATFDRRVLPGETRESILRDLRNIVAQAQLVIPNLDVQIHMNRDDGRCYTGAMIRSEGFVPAWEMSPDVPFLRMVLDGVRAAGIKPELSQRSGFGTNGCIYGGDLGIPTAVFGPSRRELAHVVDEYIDVEQLVLGCEGYYAIARELLSRKEDFRGGSCN
ncbi:MAG: peptidase M20 [Dethiosulfovibrio peptidovorans]|nr:MAG: peptidase M20 [Dethiosulfovibrio peptidovorans]